MREMKNSGIIWIGTVPMAWKVIKGRYCYSIQSGYPFASEKFSNCKGFPLIRIRDISSGLIETYFDGDYPKEYVVNKGDLLIGMDGDFNIRLWDNIDAVLNQRCCRIYENEKYDRRFLFYVLPFNLELINYFAYATTVKHLSVPDLQKADIPSPPLTEQQRIVSFLDRKCADIGNVLEKTKASIEEYKKLKQSVITEAVTKGVRGARTMKDSGIEWIGKIPEKWIVEPLWGTIRRRTEVNHPNEMVLSLYRDYGIIPKDSRDDNHNVTSLDTSNYKYVRIGDLVVNKMKAWQGSMAISDYEGIVSPAYHVCEIFGDKFIKKYLHHLLRNQTYLPEYLRLSTGMRVGQWDLSYDDLRHIPVIIPPLEEQAEIISYIDKKCSEIDSLIASKEKFITELESYKKSLIYEYVTGKKEVPSTL